MTKPRLRYLAIILGTLLLVTAGCGHNPAGSDSDEETTAPPSTIVMAVTGAKAIRAPMEARLRLLGTTVARRHLTLRAPAAGRMVGFSLQNGDAVRRGQIVARLINREIEAAENGLAVARNLDPDEAAALAASLHRNRSNMAIAVTVPEDSIVAQRIVSDGQIVAELDPIADLIDPRSIYVEAAVPVDQLAKLRPGMSAAITSPLGPDARLTGRVEAVAPSFSPGGATLPVRIELVGADRLKQSGAPVEAAIVIAAFPDAITVPDAALFEDASSGAHYLFVAGSDGLAHRTPITPGIQSEGRTQILAGIVPGTIVITSGGYALSDGLRVRVAVATP